MSDNCVDRGSSDSAKDEARVRMENRTKRGSGFSASEDACMARAWITVSEDAVVGSEQKGDVFFRSVHDLYVNKFKPPSKPYRSFESVKKRTKLIVKSCTAFAACSARIIRAKPSGANEADYRRLATALYNEREIKNEDDDPGPPFKFEDAYEILRDHPKFLMALDISTADLPLSDKTDTSDLKSDFEKAREDASEEIELTRPVGRRKAKAMEGRQELLLKKVKFSEEVVKEQKRRNEILQAHHELELFTRPLNTEDEDACEYIRLMRKKVLARARQELKEEE